MAAAAAVQAPAGFELARHPSIDFIDNRLAQTDDKFSKIGGQYDPQSQNFVTDKNKTAIETFKSASVVKRKADFANAIKDYYTTRQGSKLPSIFAKSTVLTWDDVTAQVKTAQSDYEGVSKSGILGNLRDKLRSFSDHTSGIEMWMKLLPNDAWEASLVCGGVKVVLQAATTLGAIRGDMCDALEQIPETIANAQTLAAVYKDDARLQDHNVRLYVAILNVLEHLLLWYRKHPFKKFVGALFSGPDYGNELRTRISRMKALGKKIDKDAMVNLHAEQAVDRETNQAIMAGVTQNNEQTVQILNGMKELLNDRETNSKYQAELERLRAELENKERLIERERRLKIDGRRAFFFQVLSYRKAAPLQDLQESLRIDSDLYDDAQDRAAWMLQSPEVARWLGSPVSRSLLINGGEMTHDVQSATSFFTAMMVRSLTTTSPGLVLQWFCGQNIHDPVQRMLRSLIGQLLENISPQVEIPDPNSFGRANNVGDLTRLFGELIREQLQWTSVICVLDSVSFYEDQERCSDLVHVFNRLSNMVSRVRTADDCQLKLMVTSPTRALDLCNATGALDSIVLDCPDEVQGAMVRLDEADLVAETRRHLASSSGRQRSRQHE